MSSEITVTKTKIKIRCVSVSGTDTGQLVGSSVHYSHFPMSLAVSLDHYRVSVDRRRDIFSESYDQQLSDFDFQSVFVKSDF